MNYIHNNKRKYHEHGSKCKHIVEICDDCGNAYCTKCGKEWYPLPLYGFHVATLKNSSPSTSITFTQSISSNYDAKNDIDNYYDEPLEENETE